MRTGHKLALGFAAVTLLAGVVVYISINASRHELQKAIGRRSVAFAARLLDRIDRNIYSRIESFQEYSKDPLVQQVIAASHKDFEQSGDVHACIQARDQEWCSVPKDKITPLMRGIMANELSEALRLLKPARRPTTTRPMNNGGRMPRRTGCM